MNNLKARLLRRSDLDAHAGSLEPVKKPVANLDAAPSAFEINLDNPPAFLYNRPSRHVPQIAAPSPVTFKQILRDVEFDSVPKSRLDEGARRMGRGRSQRAAYRESVSKLSAIIKPKHTAEVMRKEALLAEKKKPLMEKKYAVEEAPKGFPNRRTEQEYLMFKEIFVKPKEQELARVRERDETDLLQNEEFKRSLKEQREEQRRIVNPVNVELNHSNMANESLHKTQKSAREGFLKVHTPHKADAEEGGLPPGAHDLLAEMLADGPRENVVASVLRKFNVRASKGSASFFVQQVTVQPPEGLNATVAAPLSPGGGWAPSGPSGAKASQLKDLTLRAKSGVQQGDVQKEAHMSFALAALNEEKGKLKTAVKFYKRFFFCARVLEDPVGAALALNRIGVTYHKHKKYEKSLTFHVKHSEFTDADNLFAAFYNAGISLRFL